MREINPFAYFLEHASAIEGFGGDRRSPDPRYCFHTHYVEVRPGLAWYELRLDGVRSTHGELTVRVHAFKPSVGGHAVLVGGARLSLAGGQENLSVAVRFLAVHDVHYAFYGLFSEPTDIVANVVHVALHEPEGQEAIYVEPPASALAMRQEVHEVRPANALIHRGALRMDAPVSQNCTRAQLALVAQAGQDVEQGIMAWCEAVCLAALTAYDIDMAGLEGMTLGSVSEGVLTDISRRGFLMRSASGPPPGAESTDFVDFLLWPEGPTLQGNAQERWMLMRGWLGRLKMAGLAAVCVRYYPTSELTSSSVVADSGPTRNEIGQWALNLIGDGFSVAPLGFAPFGELALDKDGLATLLLVVRRS